MTEQAEVLNVEALDGLRHLLEHIGRSITRALDSAENEIAIQLRRIDNARDFAIEEVRRAERELDGAEEEDQSACEAELEAAEKLLHRIELAQENVISAVIRLQGIGATGSDEIVRNGIAFLSEKRAQLQNYLALQADGGDSVHQVARLPSSPAISEGRTDFGAAGLIDLSYEALSKLELPTGFQWIKLEAISLRDALRPNERFGKGVSRDDMVQGFSALRTGVLPLLQSKSSADQEFFRNSDMENGVYGTEAGLLRCYEAFFSKTDSIVLDRTQGSTEYGVTNGRHRIEVARELGWSAVPAQVLSQDDQPR
jgi:hypothetical protein